MPNTFLTIPNETKPFYFRASNKALFGCFHKPQSHVIRDCGIVLCYPLGQEYIWSHLTFRALAHNLSRAGFSVLRFECSGCGDSEGDCEQWSVHQWKTDIECALTELKTRGDVKKICLIGLRLGATLAMMVGGNHEDVEGMVLWDPVINGRDYVAELKAQHQIHLIRNEGLSQNLAQDNEDEEVIGFNLTRSFLAELQSINLLSVSSPHAKKILFIQSPESPLEGDVERQMRKTHPLVQFQHLPSNAIGIKGNASTRKVVPQRIIESVVSWTSEVFQ